MKQNNYKKLVKELNWYRYKCKEGCYECCTSFPLLESELKEMKKELIKKWYTEPPNWIGWIYCQFLTKEWRCSVYNVRPIICRWFSNVKFRMIKKDKEAFTKNCSYAKERIINASKEFMEYWNELIEDWIIIWDLESLKNSLNPLL